MTPFAFFNLDTHQFNFWTACYGAPIDYMTVNREGPNIYIDEYVISGLVIIALTICFFGGVYRFIKNDIAKHAGDKQP